MTPEEEHEWIFSFRPEQRAEVVAFLKRKREESKVAVPSSGRFYVVNGKVRPAREVSGRSDGVVTHIEIEMMED